MKIKYLAILCVAMLTVGCAKELSSNQPQQETQTTTSTTSPVKQKTQTVAESGTFKAGEHPTKGTVRVITEKGKRFLEFDGNFKTDNGPDLFVILHRSDAPPESGVKEKDYVKIARLQKTSGTQRYAVPENVNLADFKSVAIWCRAFNATFGYAPLGS
jgi:Electron transfer DM13